MQRPDTQPSLNFADDTESCSLDPLEVLRSAASAEGMPVEWAVDHAHVPANEQMGWATS